MSVTGLFGTSRSERGDRLVDRRRADSADDMSVYRRSQSRHRSNARVDLMTTLPSDGSSSPQPGARAEDWVERADVERPSGPSGLAYEYLLAGRRGDEAASERLVRELGLLSDDDLDKGLSDDAARKAFWIDIYNGAASGQRDIRLGSWRERVWFRRQNVITIAGERLSLGDIENDVLRRSQRR